PERAYGAAAHDREPHAGAAARDRSLPAVAYPLRRRAVLGRHGPYARSARRDARRWRPAARVLDGADARALRRPSAAPEDEAGGRAPYRPRDRNRRRGHAEN